jgi:hypothetical protein
MPPIGHLHSVWRALRDAIGISAGTITGDDLDTGMLTQPVGDCRRFAVRQQIDDGILLEVHKHRAVSMTSPPCPIINPKHPGHRRGCFDTRSFQCGSQ